MAEINIDALAESEYAAHNPEFADEDAANARDFKSGISQLIDDTDTLIGEFKAVKENFTTRKFNLCICALEEIMCELERMV